MNIIKKSVKNEIEISKSRFITYLYKVDSLDEVNNYLDKTKDEYEGATHYCYAYIIDGNIKCSDDKEPSKTAGAPILNVLQKNNLNHILCIVVRYFGGIKLGAGGLVRAYSTSCSEALSKTEIVELKEAYKVKISIDYNDIEQLNYLLKDDKITYKEFDQKVIYEVIIEKEKISKLEKYNYEIIEETFTN